jgi:hypothetical protein
LSPMWMSTLVSQTITRDAHHIRIRQSATIMTSAVKAKA